MPLLFLLTPANFAVTPRSPVLSCVPAASRPRSSITGRKRRPGKEQRGEGKERRERGWGVGGRTNVAAANGFIGMIPVINFFLSLLRRQNEKGKVELKCEQQPQSVTRRLNK